MKMTQSEFLDLTDEFDIVRENIVDKRRWFSNTEFIIKRDDGVLLRAFIDIPNTESQELEGDVEIEVDEVESYEKTVKGYRKVAAMAGIDRGD